MIGTIAQTAARFAAATAVVTLMRPAREDIAVEPLPLTLDLHSFEAVALDGSVLLRVEGAPLADAILAVETGGSTRFLSPLPGGSESAVGFAADAAEVEAGSVFTLITRAGVSALPAPIAR